MVIKGNDEIPYMNESGVAFFNQFKQGADGSSGTQLQQDFLSIIRKTQRKNRNKTSSQIPFRDHLLEYFIAPFTGYSGEELQWLMIKDVTNEKKNEHKLSQIHSDIDLLLKKKIELLNTNGRVRRQLRDQLISLKSCFIHDTSVMAIIGSSEPMHRVTEMASRVAKTDATVLITGESGTGKELVANLIKDASGRSTKPYLKINCNTITDTLLESDLFGYEKGAFTGADVQKKGKFEVVTGGTLFLDEIGDISPRMQAALLRVLQDGEVIRVGGNNPLKVDVRIVAATNRNLDALVKTGQFRLDLFYRLNIINIPLPPLRDHKEDIPDLVHYFIHRYNSAFDKHISHISRSLLDRLFQYNWPGNIRELENFIQRAVLMSKGSVITEDESYFEPQSIQAIHDLSSAIVNNSNGKGLKSMLAEVEREILLGSLKKYNGNVMRASKQLKIGKTAFYDKLKRFNISSKDHR